MGGVARAEWIEEAKQRCVQRPLQVEDILTADRLWLTNAPCSCPRRTPLSSSCLARRESGAAFMLCLIDNYDSFTYNIVTYLWQLGIDVRLIKNDALSIEQLKQQPIQRLIISPGPGRPEQAGFVACDCAFLSQHVPIFGICLGHQALAQAFSARIVHAKRVMHGKLSRVYHDS